MRPGAKVLDVGCGSGYLCAAFYELVKDTEPTRTQVVGIEHIPELAKLSVDNLKKSYSQPLSDGKIKIVTGDGRLGWPEHAPYDVIHVGAAAIKVPEALLKQLAPGGRMVIPVGDYMQEMMIIEKDAEGNIGSEKLLDVRYVPLTDADKQYPKGACEEF